MATPNRSYPIPETTDLATVPAHLAALATPIDADVQELADRLDAREHLVVVHHADGTWGVTTGLGEPVPINDLGDGTYSIGA